jgi:hypothetical protein
MTRKEHPTAKVIRSYLEMMYRTSVPKWKTALQHIVCRTEQGRQHMGNLMQRYPSADRTELLEAQLCQGAAFVLASLQAAKRFQQKSDRR